MPRISRPQNVALGFVEVYSLLSLGEVFFNVQEKCANFKEADARCRTFQTERTVAVQNRVAKR